MMFLNFFLSLVRIKIIIIVFFIRNASSYASSSSLEFLLKEELNLPDFKENFNVYKLNTSKIEENIGKAHYYLTKIKNLKEVIYKLDVSYALKINNYNYENDLIYIFKAQHQVYLDAYLKIISFSGFVEETNQFLSKRSGYYRHPFLYVNKDSKLYRVYKFDKGIFSSFIVDYFIYSNLKKKGDSISYKFFNLISLDVEEEKLSYVDDIVLTSTNILNRKLLKYFSIQNLDNKVDWQYYYTQDNRLIQKTDFKGNVLWKNIDF